MNISMAEQIMDIYMDRTYGSYAKHMRALDRRSILVAGYGLKLYMKMYKLLDIHASAHNYGGAYGQLVPKKKKQYACVCSECDKSFTAEHHAKWYCSDKCRDTAAERRKASVRHKQQLYKEEERRVKDQYFEEIEEPSFMQHVWEGADN